MPGLQGASFWQVLFSNALWFVHAFNCTECLGALRSTRILDHDHRVEPESPPYSVGSQMFGFRMPSHVVGVIGGIVTIATSATVSGRGRWARFTCVCHDEISMVSEV